MNLSPLLIRRHETGMYNPASSSSWLLRLGRVRCQLKEINTKMSRGHRGSAFLASLVKS